MGLEEYGKSGAVMTITDLEGVRCDCKHDHYHVALSYDEAHHDENKWLFNDKNREE
jgi:hypothetical protein